MTKEAYNRIMEGLLDARRLVQETRLTAELIIATRTLCNRLTAMGYGNSADKALPGEFDTVVLLLDDLDKRLSKLEGKE